MARDKMLKYNNFLQTNRPWESFHKEVTFYESNTMYNSYFSRVYNIIINHCSLAFIPGFSYTPLPTILQWNDLLSDASNV